MTEEQRPTSGKVRLGSLWNKPITGRVIMTGSITIDGKETRIKVFPNGFAKSDRSPDFVIYLDDYKKPDGVYKEEK